VFIAHDATNWYVKCFVFIETTTLNAIIIIKTHVRKILNRQIPSSPQPPALANDKVKIYRRPLTPHQIRVRLSIILLSSSYYRIIVIILYYSTKVLSKIIWRRYSQFVLVRLLHLVIAFDPINLAVHDILETVSPAAVLIHFYGVPIASVRLSILA